WYFIKGLLDTRTAAKVAIVGSKFMKELEADVLPEAIPECLGGDYKGYNEPFAFDVSEGGLLAYPHMRYPFEGGSDLKVRADELEVSAAAPTSDGDGV
ncbi:unnamed protein product, partial [Symbiodinium microadriaticum]